MKKILKTYKIVRDVKDTVLSPVKAIRNAIRDFLLKRGVEQLLRWFETKYPDVKPPEWKKDIHMTIPAALCLTTPAADIIELVVMIADDVLAVPLAAIGYKLGSLSCSVDGSHVTIHVHAKMIKD